MKLSNLMGLSWMAISLISSPIALSYSVPDSLQQNSKLSTKLKARVLELREERGQSQVAFPIMIYFTDKGSDVTNKLNSVKLNINELALKRRVLNRGEARAIVFEDIPLESGYINQVKSRVVKIRHELKMLNAVSAEITPQMLQEITRLSFVKKVDLISKLKRQPTPPVTVSLENSLPGQSQKTANSMMLEYGNSFTQNNQINVPEVHDMGLSGNGVVIAVFDSGFNRLSHESFSQMDIAGMWDFVNNDGNVADESDMGTGSHGTNTLSVIGGFSPGILIGPAYGATYYLAKTENNESELHVEEDNWCAAAEWADANGAQIITSSLGYTVFDQGVNYSPDDMDGNTTIVTQCADLIAESGIVVINSAGNGGNVAQSNTIGAPADGNSVLAVGAVDASGSRVSFSSYGPSADGRIKPDVMAMGQGVLVASSLSDTGYGNANGTSFSCPLTAGVAALLLESSPNLTASEVRELIRNSAGQASNPDNLNGYGIINALAAVYAANGQFVPEASFVHNEVDAMTIQFTNTSSDSDGTIVSYLWDFGDGNRSTLENPTHRYAEPGSFSLTLRVTDNEGLESTTSRTVFIEAQMTSSSGSGSLGGLSIFILLLTLFQRRRIELMG
ncbi:S8 family serine peptidase [Aliikangiella marina]|uniref:S8 family serine peptidase n=1 Tax=Aliikangiella marina TaxID=1712262 RepID=A0A545TCV2_9GAMM|nr:S8 family serine peptidase [Aliikangiella marina]TQV75050.1 S8 family serine peptidase [Aliikangiella marina]